MPKFCIIIPVFNHAKLLQSNIEKILSFGFPVILINDGSNEENRTILQQIKGVTLLHLQENQGKGAALMRGFFYAFENGFTHALQIDADDQHEISDIPLFIELAKANEKALINGIPLYDQSAPKSRTYGRKITNFWVAIETNSLDIRDAMCGFRIYPLAETIALTKNQSLSKRMGFDIEIIVRLYWAGVKIINQPTKVIYPAHGSSNFKMLRDNLAISALHAKLFCGMVQRIFTE